MITERSITGIFHFINQTPVDLSPKNRQLTKMQRMDMSLLQHVYVLNKLFIYELLLDI